MAAILKTIHAQEDREAALEKAASVVEKLKAMKLGVAAKTVEEGDSRDAHLYRLPPRALAQA